MAPAVGCAAGAGWFTCDNSCPKLMSSSKGSGLMSMRCCTSENLRQDGAQRPAGPVQLSRMGAFLTEFQTRLLGLRAPQAHCLDAAS